MGMQGLLFVPGQAKGSQQLGLPLEPGWTRTMNTEDSMLDREVWLEGHAMMRKEA